jgi:hypothetical protein
MGILPCGGASQARAAPGGWPADPQLRGSSAYLGLGNRALVEPSARIARKA